jgi:Transposase DDE domain
MGNAFAQERPRAARTGTRPLRQRNHYDFGDEGYLGKQRAPVLLRPGLVLLTKVRKHMKSWLLTLTTKLLLNARNMAATIIGHIKAFSSLNLSKHRAPINAFLHLLAALTAYQLNPIKPDASFFPSLSLLA